MRSLAFVCCSCALFLTACQTAAPSRSALTSTITSAVEAGHLHGAHLLMLGDDTLAFQVSGYTDAARTRPLTAESPLYLASVSKLYTQVLLMRLVDRNLLHLDIAATTYRPALPLPPHITVRHLVEMTAGLPRERHEDITQSGVEFDEAGFAGPFLDQLQLDPMPQASDTTYAYSNLSYWMLGAVLEAVTAQSFAQLLHTEIAEPFGLQQTGFGVHADVAIGFHPPVDGQSHYRAVSPDAMRRYTSGGVYASLADVHTFVRQVWRDTTYLTPTSRAYLAALSGSSDPEVTWEGNGAMPGFTNMVYYHPGKDFLLLLLNNIGCDPPAPQQAFAVRNALIQQVTGQDLAPQQEIIEVISMERFPHTSAMGRVFDALIPAMEQASAAAITRVFDVYGAPGEFDDSESFFVALATAKQKLSPGFQVDGWQAKNNNGLSVWFSDGPNDRGTNSRLLEISLYPSAADTNLVETLGVRQIGMLLEDE